MGFFSEVGAMLNSVVGGLADLLGFGETPLERAQAVRRSLQRAARSRQTASSRGASLTVTVRQPRARIWYDKQKWAGSRLEELWDRGAVVSFEVANAITLKRKGDCRGAPHGNSWALLRPESVFVVPVDAESEAAAKKLLAFPDSLGSLALQTIAPMSVVDPTYPKGLLAEFGSRWEDKQYPPVGVNAAGTAITRTFTLPPGRYLVIASPQTSVRRTWCAPRGWWKWTGSGPRVKSYDYMKNHCTSYWTRFRHTIRVDAIGDYAVGVTVPGSGSKSVTLEPVATLFIGKRSHWEDASGKALYASCKIRGWLAKKIWGALGVELF